MRSGHAEDRSEGEKLHPVYTLRNQKEEPIVSDLLEESGVNFTIQEFDEDAMDKGYGVIMVVDHDLEIAHEIIEEYKKERPMTGEEPMLEFNEEEGSFMPLGMADKEDEEELEEEFEDEEEDEDDEDDFDDEDEDEDDLDDEDDELDEDEEEEEDEEEY